MVTEEFKPISEADTPPVAVNEEGEFQQKVNTEKVDAQAQKISPFLFHCIRESINDNPYDTHQRHPIQKSMRI